MSETQQRTRKERKELYEKVIRTVDENTGGDVMLPGQSEARLGTILKSHADRDNEAVDLAVQAAVENGDLIRYPATVKDADKLAVAEPDQLRELIGELNQRIDRAREAIEIAAKAMPDGGSDE